MSNATRNERRSKIRAKGLSFAALFVAALAAGPTRAEVGQVRIVDFQGLTHLPIRVAFDLHLIEKHAAMLGVPGLTTSFQTVGSGVVMGEMLVSGSADLGVSGTVPLLVLSDKTSGKAKLKGIMALAQSNQLLLTVDPKIRSLTDYGPLDKVAVTEPEVSTYAYTLEIAAAKKFGWEQRRRFEQNLVPMSNGDALNLMMSGATEVKSHFTVLPFTAAEMSRANVRLVLNSKDVVGFPYTSTAAVTTAGFRAANPKVYKAIVEALHDAIDLINSNPKEAAEIFLRHEKYPGGVDALVAGLQGKTPDELKFTSTPVGTSVFADVMYKDGVLKHQLSSWKECWFPEVWNEHGS